MAGKRVEVRKSPDGWIVAKVGRKSPVSEHATQAKAETAARRLAKKERAELVVKGRDGRIKRKDSFGNDPRSRRG